MYVYHISLIRTGPLNRICNSEELKLIELTRSSQGNTVYAKRGTNFESAGHIITCGVVATSSGLINSL